MNKCHWCKKDIEGFPYIHDLDLNVYFHPECNDKEVGDNMALTSIKPCPCGATPNKLLIVSAGQGGKWANVLGDCCGEWAIEFRTQYKPLDSDECMALAVEAWDKAPRQLEK